jgi:hypothetical protein
MTDKPMYPLTQISIIRAQALLHARLKTTVDNQVITHNAVARRTITQLECGQPGRDDYEAIAAALGLLIIEELAR